MYSIQNAEYIIMIWYGTISCMAVVSLRLVYHPCLTIYVSLIHNSVLSNIAIVHFTIRNNYNTCTVNSKCNTFKHVI